MEPPKERRASPVSARESGSTGDFKRSVLTDNFFNLGSSDPSRLDQERENKKIRLMDQRKSVESLSKFIEEKSGVKA